jgi:hypothetical protein
MGMFPEAFGSDPDVCRDASPTHYVARLAAPMLVITETQDPGYVRLNAGQLRRAAQQAGVKDIRFMDAEDRNHFSIVTNLARKTEDPQRTAMVTFIRERCRTLDGWQLVHGSLIPPDISSGGSPPAAAFARIFPGREYAGEISGPCTSSSLSIFGSCGEGFPLPVSTSS